MLKPLLSIVFLFLTIQIKPSKTLARTIDNSIGFTTTLTQVDSSKNLTFNELVQRAIMRSKYRAAYLQTKSKTTTTAPQSPSFEASIHASGFEFIMDLTIGTPQIPITAIADTGSDLIWTQCVGCTKCLPQPTPKFNPEKSSTYAPYLCTDPICTNFVDTACPYCYYFVQYGDNASSAGLLSQDVFTFNYNNKNNKPSSYTLDFGCGLASYGDLFNSTGLVGLGRGSFSLISQLQVGKFAYCLNAFTDKSISPLQIGSVAGLSGANIQTTPLVRNPIFETSFYYVNLQSISVGNDQLSIPKNTFGFQADGSGGLIVDSGTSITHLEQSAYVVLRKKIMSLLTLPIVANSLEHYGLDLCFKLSAGSTPPDMPSISLQFDGAILSLARDSYMFHDTSVGYFCLTMMSSSGLSILGNFQQANLKFLYDLEADKLSFVPAQCSSSSYVVVNYGLLVLSAVLVHLLVLYSSY